MTESGLLSVRGNLISYRWELEMHEIEQTAGIRIMIIKNFRKGSVIDMFSGSSLPCLSEEISNFDMQRNEDDHTVYFSIDHHASWQASQLRDLRRFHSTVPYMHEHRLGCKRAWPQNRRNIACNRCLQRRHHAGPWRDRRTQESVQVKTAKRDSPQSSS